MIFKKASNFIEDREALPLGVQSFFNIFFQGVFNLIHVFLLRTAKNITNQ